MTSMKLGPPMDNVPRRAFERLVRKVLDYPSHGHIPCSVFSFPVRGSGLNDGYHLPVLCSHNDQHEAGPPMDNVPRREFERLVRKVLDYPSRPAVMLLNTYVWHETAPYVSGLLSRTCRVTCRTVSH